MSNPNKKQTKNKTWTFGSSDTLGTETDKKESVLVSLGWVVIPTLLTLLIAYLVGA